jgi:hypothetical protein
MMNTKKNIKKIHKSHKYTVSEKKHIDNTHQLIRSSRKNYTSIGRRVHPFLHQMPKQTPTQRDLRRVGKDVVRLCTSLHSVCPRCPKHGRQHGGGGKYKQHQTLHHQTLQDKRQHYIHYLKSV